MNSVPQSYFSDSEQNLNPPPLPPKLYLCDDPLEECDN